jgi:hypothetical protein
LLRGWTQLRRRNSETGTIRLDRFIRRPLKAHLDELIKIEPAFAERVDRVEPVPAVAVSRVHDLLPHSKSTLVR